MSQTLYLAGAPVAGTNEVELLTFGGTPTGGSVKLAFRGRVTSAIAWSATNATLVSNVQTALQALISVGSGNLTVAVNTMTAGIGTLNLSFVANLAKLDVPAITVVSNSLTGSSPTVAISTTTPGVTASYRGASAFADLIDTTNNIAYRNTGTNVVPIWTQVMPRRGVLIKAADYTLTVADAGSFVLVTGADKVLTLPSTAAGLVYTVSLAAAGLSSSTGLQIAPAAADQIVGNGFTPADNKAAVLAGSGDRAGDSITLIGDGVDGWYISAVTGTWTRAS